jgi:hypothetical protein
MERNADELLLSKRLPFEGRLRKRRKKQTGRASANSESP